MKVTNFLQLIRYKNLLMLAFMQVFFSIAFIYNETNFISFSIIKLLLLIQATVFLAAAGNVINDFFDVETDLINKPNKVLVGKVISDKNTLLVYLGLNFFGVLSGLILAYISNKMIYGLLFIIISGLLYLYSKNLKKIALLGNFIVSVFIAFSIFIISIFPPFDASFFSNYERMKYYIITYSIFAFIINFIREIIKDVEDINGDYKQEMKTLPIIIGKKRTLNSVFYISFIPFIFSIFIASVLENKLVTAYVLVLITLPFAYFIYEVKEAKSKNKIHKLSVLLKIIMILGMFSILILKRLVL